MKFVFAIAAVAVAHSAFGAVWNVDPAHSTIGFKVRHALVSNVRGSFKTFSGTFDIDDKDPMKIKAEAAVDVSSIDTNQEKRDAHLKTPDFFDATKNPKITFKSTKIVKGAGSKFQMMGDLTLHGVTKPITLDVSELTPAMSGKRGFSATSTINRTNWGMDGGKPMVGETVEITVELELNPATKAE